MTSRFNKNGSNLSADQEEQWLEANATPVKAENKADTKVETAKDEATSTKEPDEGDNQKSESKKRRGLRRTKKGDNDNG